MLTAGTSDVVTPVTFANDHLTSWTTGPSIVYPFIVILKAFESLNCRLFCCWLGEFASNYKLAVTRPALDDSTRRVVLWMVAIRAVDNSLRSSIRFGQLAQTIVLLSFLRSLENSVSHQNIGGNNTIARGVETFQRIMGNVLLCLGDVCLPHTCTTSQRMAATFHERNRGLELEANGTNRFSCIDVLPGAVFWPTFLPHHGQKVIFDLLDYGTWIFNNHSKVVSPSDTRLFVVDDLLINTRSSRSSSSTKPKVPGK